MAHTIRETIDLAMKNAILRAHPIGSYYLTEGTENPQDFIGGGWQKLTGRYVLQCSDDTHAAGTTVQAGLPNITGGWGTLDIGGREGPEGAVYVGTMFQDATPTYASGSSQASDYHATFDASRSNPIYGGSDTVQPPARIVNVWKRVS